MPIIYVHAGPTESKSDSKQALVSYREFSLPRLVTTAQLSATGKHDGYVARKPMFAILPNDYIAQTAWAANQIYFCNLNSGKCEMTVAIDKNILKLTVTPADELVVCTAEGSDIGVSYYALPQVILKPNEVKEVDAKNPISLKLQLKRHFNLKNQKNITFFPNGKFASLGESGEIYLNGDMNNPIVPDIKTDFRYCSSPGLLCEETIVCCSTVSSEYKHQVNCYCFFCCAKYFKSFDQLYAIDNVRLLAIKYGTKGGRSKEVSVINVVNKTFQISEFATVFFSGRYCFTDNHIVTHPSGLVMKENEAYTLGADQKLNYVGVQSDRHYAQPVILKSGMDCVIASSGAYSINDLEQFADRLSFNRYSFFVSGRLMFMGARPKDGVVLAVYEKNNGNADFECYAFEDQRETERLAGQEMLKLIATDDFPVPRELGPTIFSYCVPNYPNFFHAPITVAPQDLPEPLSSPSMTRGDS